MKTKGLQALLIAAIAVIAWLSFKLLMQGGTSPADYVKQPSAIIDEAKTEAKITAREVDKKGYAKVVFERRAAIIGDGDISKLPVSQSVLDSLRLDNLDKSKKLEQASVINATLKATTLRAVKITDSLKTKRLIYNDEYLTASFTPDTLGGVFDFNYRIKLIRQDYTKRRNWFTPKVQYTEILSPDKRITINGLQSLTIKSPVPGRFGIGLQAGYYYDPSRKQFLPAIGAGLSYNLINF